MSSGHCSPCIHEAPQKRLTAHTPQGRPEQIGTGTQAEGRRDGAAGEPKKGLGLVFIIWFTAKGAD